MDRNTIEARLRSVSVGEVSALGIGVDGAREALALLDSLRTRLAQAEAKLAEQERFVVRCQGCDVESPAGTPHHPYCVHDATAKLRASEGNLREVTEERDNLRRTSKRFNEQSDEWHARAEAAEGRVAGLESEASALLVRVHLREKALTELLVRLQNRAKVWTGDDRYERGVDLARQWLVDALSRTLVVQSCHNCGAEIVGGDTEVYCEKHRKPVQPPPPPAAEHGPNCIALTHEGRCPTLPCPNPQCRDGWIAYAVGCSICGRVTGPSPFPPPPLSPPATPIQPAALPGVEARLEACEESLRNLAGGLRAFARSSVLASAACEEVLTRHDLPSHLPKPEGE